MYDDGEWMEGACLFAAAELYGRSIWLVTDDPLDQNTIISIQLKAATPNRPIVLAYTIGLHFTIVVPSTKAVRKNRQGS